jgi:hypothetical protein
MRALAIVLTAVCLPAAAAPGSALALGSGQGCGAQCITTALIKPYPRAFAVEVRTDTPARITASVAKRLSPGDGQSLAGPVYLDSVAGAPGKTSFFHHLQHLEPDHLYEVTFTATDAQGRTARRSTTFRTASLVTLGEGGPASFDSGAGCSAQCIQTATASAGGTTADIAVNTSVPVKLKVQADRDAPGTIGNTPIFGTPEVEVKTSQLRKQSTVALDGLKPGSQYHVIVRATDANGRFALRHGVFETDGRHARLAFQRIHVLYDGDKGANRGELTFRLRAEHNLKERHEDRIASGKWVGAPGGEILFDAAPEVLTVGAQAIERDSKSACVPVDLSGWHAANVGHTKDRCTKISLWTYRTWSTGWAALDLDDPPGGQLPPGYGGGGLINFIIRQAEPRVQPRFEVIGFVEIWYE